ncbi:MAG: UDP-N-acetylglucosamine--N-acetylmuramyl-(pentapeptide) pyrophosphoryl-undecaprenol N-acetylglucosamine transferase [Planctomycetaceae bacterium]|nr:UDP-N-acetylglucosamine--N-acetylmuramyl-(pentapeptide) pyrophosphoryl-undecaprenol N-acetylglucosamine transferase [Planctomycetaceae bacterium]
MNRTNFEWRCVAFAGGGSGGHLIPAISLARHILRDAPACRFVFLVSQRTIDRLLLETSGLPPEQLTILPQEAVTGSQLRARPLASLRTVLRSVKQARHLLRTESVQCVFGLGGFASVAGVLAARWTGEPVVLLEQNVIPGRATRSLARFANFICCGLPLEGTFAQRWGDRLHHTGTPLRSAGSSASGDDASTADPDERPLLVIVGGSQGSASVNRLATAALVSTREVFCHWRILHVSGADDQAALQEWYGTQAFSARVTAFEPRLAEEIRSAAIVVARAGAVTISEIASCSRPAVLIPLRNVADDHQMKNAELLVSQGAALVVDELSDHAESDLAEHLIQLSTNPELRQRMGEAMRTFSPAGAAEQILVLAEEAVRR